MTILDEIQASIARLAEEGSSSVVGIGQRWGVGSGIVLGEGRVLTNAHNVRGSKVTVTFADGHTADGTVAGTDVDGDLAVVEVETGQAPALPWAADAPAIGTPVFALANPGGRGLRVTFGFVSGVDRSFRGDRGGRAARDQHDPPGRGFLPRHPRRRGAAEPGRRAGQRRIRPAAAPGRRDRSRPRSPAAAPCGGPPGRRRP